MKPPPTSKSSTFSGMLWAAVAFLVVLQIMGPDPAPTPVADTGGTAQSPSATSGSSAVIPTGTSGATGTTPLSIPEPVVPAGGHPEGTWTLDDERRTLEVTARGAAVQSVLLKINDDAAIRGYDHEILGEFSRDHPHFETSLQGLRSLASVNWKLAVQEPGRLVFELSPEPGVTLTKEYRLGEGYLIHVTTRARAADGRELTLVQSGANGLEPGNTAGLQGGTFYLEGDFLGRRDSGTLAVIDFDFGDLEDGPVYTNDPEQGLGGLDFVWVGHSDNYFACLVRPTSPATGRLGAVSVQAGQDPTGLTAALEARAAGMVEISCDVYLGPRHRPTLEALDPGLTGIFEGGLLGPIKGVLLWILEMMYAVVGSYGWAIILLTLVVRLAIHPLSRRGQIKMAQYQEKIQKIQPKLDKLKKKHEGDRQAFAQAQMKLMRENNVSGGAMLGGCLPMLMQMPIFLSLYYMLQENIELRGTQFLWITDLSLPDRLIPDFPIWPGTLNILPLMTLAVTVIQMKRSMARNAGKLSPEQEASQKMMIYIMPLVMIVFTYSFAAGLLLYWFTSALFGIFEAEMTRRAVDKLRASGAFR